MKKYQLQHTGYPVGAQAIQENEWSLLSTHSSESAAFQAMNKARAHLSPGTWDDHYRVIAPDGTRCNYQLWQIRQECKTTAREWRKLSRLSNHQ